MLGKHLLGIYEKAFDASSDYQEILFRAKGLGFDFVELSIDENDARIKRLYDIDDERTKIMKAIEKTNIGFQSMCLSAHRRFPFGSSDSAVRKQARELMRLGIRYAHETGIRVIQLAGYDVYYEKSTAESRQEFFDGLKYACEEAERYQVMLAMEIMDTPFLNSISRYMEFKERLKSSWFTVYPDMGNLSAWDNDVMAELEKGRDHIVGMHVKETLKVTEQFEGRFKCVPFGTGCVNFSACFKKLEEMGYCGPYMIEMWHQPGGNDRQSVLEAKRFVEERYRHAMNRKR